MSVVVFKPDEIGDFLIATGAIRVLAREHGEENTTILVKSEVAPLARREFPLASVVELPWQPRRKGRNQTVANIRHCFPVWSRLRRLHTAQSVCLRSRRNSLQTILFAAPRAARLIASENVLANRGGARRRLLEMIFGAVSRPLLAPYPSVHGDLPRELASHRAVVAAALGREIGSAEIMPLLSSAAWRGGGGWLLCPFSSRRAKDYSADRWAAALREASAQSPLPPILLAGGPDQMDRLQDFAAVLRAAGIACQVAPGMPLDRFPELVARADMMLTVDTAAAHFACACRAPAVVVACGLHEGTYGPYSPDGRQIWLTGDWAGRGREGWQDTVPPSEVAAAINRARRL